MLVVAAALQVSEQIRDVGAYAGLASVLGLAVLSLLYFGQARELKRLRDWAGRAPERTAELQEQANAAAAAAAQAPPSRGVAQPVGAPAVARTPAQTPATAAGVAARPAVAATAAGTAVTAAGTPAASAPGGPAPVPGGPAAPAGTPVPAALPVAAAPGAPPVGSPAAAPGQETQAIPAITPGAPLPPATPSVAAPMPIGPEPPPTGETPTPLRQGSPGQPRRRPAAEAYPPEVEARPERSGSSRRTLGIVVGSVAALALVVVLALTVLGGGDAAPSRASTTQTSTDNEFVEPPSQTGPSGTTAAPPVKPGDVAVFVLNGTSTNGIAAEVAKTLETDGYRIADTGNSVVSNATTTEVFYNEGKKRGASAVAAKLDVDAANVKAAARDIAVQGPGADVIVQIGTDKASG